jgi:hypothetical protein
LPCDSIQRSQISFLATSTDLNLLADGLRALGFTVRESDLGLDFYKAGITGTYAKATGKLTSRGYNELDIDEVKRSYSKAVVNSQAKKFGWKIDWKKNAEGFEEATVIKRG